VSPASTVPPDTIRLFYGTDRARKRSARGVIGYSWRRGDRLERGICWVSIPPDQRHQMGALEGPSWFKLQFKYDTKKHVTLHEIAPLERDLWLQGVRWLGTTLDTKQLLLFVHGYNVTFRAAARRSAQFVYDLGFAGVPMFYSWPSCGATLLYPFDEAAVQNAESHLQRFIEDAVTSGEFESVFLVAHSMGNRVMTAALERAIGKTASLGVRIRHLILAAPDIDAGYFKDTIAPNLMALGLKMTLYVSSRDRALAISRWFHGWPRLGDAKKGIVVIPGIDTIDASNVDTSFIGHSPFADRRELLSDIHYLIDGATVAARHGLDPLDVNAGRYYRFRR
jgi:esterase/lipase superfamily enzyme